MLNKPLFATKMMELSQVFPGKVPTSSEGHSVWYDKLVDLSDVVFELGVERVIRREDWPTIAAIRSHAQESWQILNSAMSSRVNNVRDRYASSLLGHTYSKWLGPQPETFLPDAQTSAVHWESELVDRLIPDIATIATRAIDIARSGEWGISIETDSDAGRTLAALASGTPVAELLPPPQPEPNTTNGNGAAPIDLAETVE